eukprot:8048269-Alexandrium_andersonii.AAC.1
MCAPVSRENTGNSRQHCALITAVVVFCMSVRSHKHPCWHRHEQGTRATTRSDANRNSIEP